MSAQVNTDLDKEVYLKTCTTLTGHIFLFLTPFRLPVSLQLQPKYLISQLVLLKFSLGNLAQDHPVLQQVCVSQGTHQSDWLELGDSKSRLSPLKWNKTLVGW